MNTTSQIRCGCGNLCPTPAPNQWIRCSRCGAALILSHAAAPSAPAGRSLWPYPLLLGFVLLLGMAVPVLGIVAFLLLAIGGVAVVLGKFSRSLAAIMFGRMGPREQVLPSAVLDIVAGLGLAGVLVAQLITGAPALDLATTPAPLAAAEPPAATPPPAATRPPGATRPPAQMSWDEFEAFVIRRGMTRVRAVDMKEEGMKMQATNGKDFNSAWFAREGDSEPFRLVNLGEVPYGSLHDVVELYLGARPSESIPDKRRRKGGEEYFTVRGADGRPWTLQIANAHTEVRREVLLCDPSRWPNCRE